MENLIDFSDPILRLVLPILLKDQTTGKNIIWATDPPPNVDCGPMGEITIEQLDRIKLVPRVQKRLSEQKKRTKGKAEVFTPLWVVKKMADHAEQELNKGNWERQHDSWGTCIDLVHAIEHQQWLDAPEGKKEAPGTTYRSHGPVPLGREPYPKIEKE